VRIDIVNALEALEREDYDTVARILKDLIDAGPFNSETRSTEADQSLRFGVIQLLVTNTVDGYTPLDLVNMAKTVENYIVNGAPNANT
jgi:hypothetical protein